MARDIFSEILSADDTEERSDRLLAIADGLGYFGTIDTFAGFENLLREPEIAPDALAVFLDLTDTQSIAPSAIFRCGTRYYEMSWYLTDDQAESEIDLTSICGVSVEHLRLRLEHIAAYWAQVRTDLGA